MSEKVKFGSRLGVIAATVGSAVGLGTVWRFPAEAQSNGGGAFLLIYVLCVLVIGIPVMLTEFSLGRGGEGDPAGALKRLAPGTHWKNVGLLAILSSYIVLVFYMVVAGWTLEYLWGSVTGGLFDGVSAHTMAETGAGFHHKMEEYICGTAWPLTATCILVAINIGVLLMGVQKGIEKMSNILMPLLFVLLVVFACESLTLDRAAEGLAYFFKPDFSKIDTHVWLNALGQAFFSLSLGMGILVTYGSYYPKDVKLGRTSAIVSSLVVVVALLMGIIIFPAVVSFGVDLSQVRGTTLVFVTLPEIFMQMPCPRLWAVLFFLLLMVAALTSTISVAEVGIAYVQERYRLKRKWAVLRVMLPVFILSGIVSLSFGPLADWQVMGMNLFDLLDNTATDIMLPLTAILVCVFMGWFAPKGVFYNQITNYGTLSARLYPLVLFVIKWVAPVCILLVFLNTFLKF